MSAKRRRPAPDCSSGKMAFATQGEALRELERQRRENAQAVVPMAWTLRSAYRCQKCGAWHLTKRKDGVHA